jgi:hypothetical protein
MFTSSTELSRDIRKNLFTFLVTRDNVQDSVCGFDCNLWFEYRENEPYRVFVQYHTTYNYIDDDDDVCRDIRSANLYFNFNDFMQMFNQRYTEYVVDIMKSKLRGELLEKLYDKRIDGNTRLCDIPKKLLDPEVNVLDCTDAYNTKIGNLRKHLIEVFDTEHPDDLSSFNAVDIKTLSDITGDEIYLWSGTVKLENKHLLYDFDTPNEPLPEFIDTFDEVDKNTQGRDVFIGGEIYSKIGD